MRPGLFTFKIHHDCIAEIKSLQPSVVKAFASVTSDDWWASVADAAPNAIRVLVHGEISDNQDLSNADADADATAKYLSDKPHCPRTVICKNEYPIWNGADARETWSAYMVRWIIRMHSHGLHVVAGEFNSGWPRVSLLDDVNWWPDFAAVDNVLDAGDYWGLHEYWGKAGPLGWWPWTVGRHLRCPTAHNILIDECGYDGNTDGLGYNQGWVGVLTSDVYADHIIQYHRMLLSDPRVKGTALFLMDYQDRKWTNFDIWPIREQLIARAPECDTIHPAVVMPARIHLPVTSYVRITQTFAEHKANNPRGGWGLDFSCATGTDVLAAADGTVDKNLDYGGLSYGKMAQVNHLWGFTRSAHLNSFTATKGDKVQEGQHIAESGTTGNSTGPHLHFEVIPFANRVWPYRVDPAPLIFGTEEEDMTDVERQRVKEHANSIPFSFKACHKVGLTWGGVEWIEGNKLVTVGYKAGETGEYRVTTPAGNYDINVVTPTVEKT
jgi:hypothetical protein